MDNAQRITEAGEALSQRAIEPGLRPYTLKRNDHVGFRWSLVIAD
jgi:hypothetical protein